MSDSRGDLLVEQLMRFRPDGLSANGWAVLAGVGRTVWADMRRHGNPSRRTLEKLLRVAGSSLAEFEALRSEPEVAEPSAAVPDLADLRRGWRGAGPSPLPLFAASPGGDYRGFPGVRQWRIDRRRPIAGVDRPRRLAGERDAYALTVADDSMWPRFRAGRRLAVAPGLTAAAGDDVVVTLRGDEALPLVLVKELIERTAAGLKLRQFSPDLVFVVAGEEVVKIETVVGELI